MQQYRLRVQRSSGWVDYTIRADPGSSVLHLLEQLRTRHDLAVDCACGHGLCGLCAVQVNGKGSLACRTVAPPEMCVAPANPRRTLRDLALHLAGEIR